MFWCGVAVASGILGTGSSPMGSSSLMYCTLTRCRGKVESGDRESDNESLEDEPFFPDYRHRFRSDELTEYGVPSLDCFLLSGDGSGCRRLPLPTAASSTEGAQRMLDGSG